MRGCCHRSRHCSAEGQKRKKHAAMRIRGQCKEATQKEGATGSVVAVQTTGICTPGYVLLEYYRVLHSLRVCAKVQRQYKHTLHRATNEQTHR